MKFQVIKEDCGARRGIFETVHGTVQTPAFMNVATAAAIKGGLSAEDLNGIGTQVMLATHIICMFAPAMTLFMIWVVFVNLRDGISRF